jgi:hypothetical protein
VNQKRNWILVIGGIVLIIALSAVAIAVFYASQRPKSPPAEGKQLAGPLPTEGWYICALLDQGDVPGMEDQRPRFRLCHDQGWEILAYGLQPRWPAPELGAACTRLDMDTYWCGEGVQNLRQYRIMKVPSPAQTATPTLAPIPTMAAPSLPPPALPTPTPPSASPTDASLADASAAATLAAPAAPQQPAASFQRSSPGGMGFAAWLGLANWLPTRTPFLPPTRTPFMPVPSTPIPSEPPASGSRASQPSQSSFYGIDFSDTTQRIRIKIYPADRGVNGGKPIVIAFVPGDRCEYGDRRACINAFASPSGGATTLITVHSGLGGEGQKFRHAVEGTGFDAAWFTPQKVQANLRLLEGAEVTITQGETTLRGLQLVSAGRVPPQQLQAYMHARLPDALALAASLNPSLAPAASPTLPQIVFETCGWKMPGEKWAPGVTSTSASIYLGVIQKNP